MVKLPSELNPLVPGVVVSECIEVFGSDSCRHQMDHSVVAAISKGGPSPALLVHNGLKFFLGHVGGWVDSAAVADDDRRRFAHLSQASKVVLGIHLKSDEEALELDSFLHVEFGHEDHSTCLYNEGGYFWDGEDSESLLSHFLNNAVEGCAFPCAGPASDDYLVDGVSGQLARVFHADVFLEVDLVPF